MKLTAVSQCHHGVWSYVAARQGRLQRTKPAFISGVDVTAEGCQNSGIKQFGWAEAAQGQQQSSVVMKYLFDRRCASRNMHLNRFMVYPHLSLGST